MLRSFLKSISLVLLLAVSATGSIEAQLISLRTVPVASGDQFVIFPSTYLGMGGVGIALDDPIGDPFTNPATASRVEQSYVFSAPIFYSITRNSGSARTLPVGALFNSERWFGGVVAVMQDLDRGGELFGWDPFIGPTGPTLGSTSAVNKYVNLTVGHTLPSGLAFGGSVLLSDLGAVDGVEHLYANATDIRQAGNMQTFRLGVSQIFDEDGALEVSLIHHLFNMTHNVSYIEWGDLDTLTWQRESFLREEVNQDRSRTWGANISYHQSIGEDGWRLGGTLTGNRKSHPKIPNYELMNIPRDPGFSNAFDFGLGIAKLTESTVFGIDVVFQPAMSETWAEADGPTATVKGDTIPDGGKTVENSFAFSNAFVNLGLTHHFESVSLQFGLAIRSYDYHLDQWNNVEDTFRMQDESWTEWVPSWGWIFHLTDLDVQYMGRVTTGTGRPGVAGTGGVFWQDRVTLASSGGNDILLAPSGQLTLTDVSVITHQISVSIPIR